MSSEEPLATVSIGGDEVALATTNITQDEVALSETSQTPQSNTDWVTTRAGRDHLGRINTTGLGTTAPTEDWSIQLDDDVAGNRKHFILRDGAVFVHDSQYCYRLDPSDGSQLWRFDTANSLPSDAADPEDAYHDGDRIYYSSDDATNPAAFALDPADGSLLWSTSFDEATHSVFRSADYVILESTYALDPTDGSQVYTLPNAEIHASYNEATDGIMSTESTNAAEFDQSDGSTLRSTSAGVDLGGPMPVGTGRAFYPDLGTNINVIELSGFTVENTVNVDGNFIVSTALDSSEDFLYVLTDSDLYKIDASNGGEEWNDPVNLLDDYNEQMLLVEGESVLYFGDQGGSFHAINRSDGSFEWSVSAFQFGIAALAIQNGALYALEGVTSENATVKKYS